MNLCPYLLVVAACLALGIAPVNGQGNASGSSSSKNTKSEQRNGAKPNKPQPAPDASDQTVYRNSEFGFRYNVILGWVDRTKQMQPEATQTGEPSAPAGQVLLAGFERPPEAAGDTVNSAVVIAQESAATYPGLKTAADYVGPLTELVTSKGFKAVGEPFEITLDAKALVRCDFMRETGKVLMYQSNLVFLQKGSIVLFTFIGGSLNEIDALIERLSFQRAAAAKPK
jgi:hypothetical protein